MFHKTILYYYNPHWKLVQNHLSFVCFLGYALLHKYSTNLYSLDDLNGNYLEIVEIRQRIKILNWCCLPLNNKITFFFKLQKFKKKTKKQWDNIFRFFISNSTDGIVLKSYQQITTLGEGEWSLLKGRPARFCNRCCRAVCMASF